MVVRRSPVISAIKDGSSHTLLPLEEGHGSFSVSDNSCFMCGRQTLPMFPSPEHLMGVLAVWVWHAQWGFQGPVPPQLCHLVWLSSLCLPIYKWRLNMRFGEKRYSLHTTRLHVNPPKVEAISFLPLLVHRPWLNLAMSTLRIHWSLYGPLLLLAKNQIGQEWPSG